MRLAIAVLCLQVVLGSAPCAGATRTHVMLGLGYMGDQYSTPVELSVRGELATRLTGPLHVMGTLGYFRSRPGEGGEENGAWGAAIPRVEASQAAAAMVGLELEGNNRSGGGFLSASAGLGLFAGGDMIFQDPSGERRESRDPVGVPAFGVEAGIRIGPPSGRASLRLSLGVTGTLRAESAYRGLDTGYVSAGIGF